MLTAHLHDRRAPVADLVLRSVQLGDEAILQDYFRRLSPTARYYRLHGGASELPALELARALAADGVEALSLLFVHRTAGSDTVVGEARVAFSYGGHMGEFAMSIAEDWRRLGLGAALLAGIERLATDGSAACLFGDVLYDNSAMIALARGRGFQLEVGPEARLVRVYKRLVGALRILDDPAPPAWRPKDHGGTQCGVSH